MTATSQEKQDHQVLCLNPVSFHHMHYRTYGDPDKPPLIMVHGLTRTGDDFEPLAEHLCHDYYVICPDIVGRGRSDWLPPGMTYSYPQYLSDLTALMARQANKQPITWLGTSMGGLLGIILAALPNSPIKRLILNDIGPMVSNQTLCKLKDALQNRPPFTEMSDAIAYVKKAYMGFGNLTDDQWEIITKSTFKQNTDGTLQLHYDPRIGDFPLVNEQNNTAADANLWPYWLMLNCPILILRGSESQVLPPELLDSMLQTKPKATAHTIAGAAHAPALMDDHSINLIKDWLNETET